MVVCFASVATVHECDIMRHRRHGLRLLRDIIAGFDEVQHPSSALLLLLLRLVDEMKTEG